MSAVSDRIDNMKLAWEGLTFGQKAGMVAGIVLPGFVIGFLVVAFMGGGDEGQAPNLGSTLIQNQSIDTVPQPLSDGADSDTVENRYAGGQAQADRSLNSGSSFMAAPDLRSSQIDPSSIQPEPVPQSSEPVTEIREQASYVDALRRAPPRQTGEATPPDEEPAPVRNNASERLQQSMGGKPGDVANDPYSGLSRDQYVEYVEGETERMAGIFSTRRTKLDSLYAVAPSGEFAVSSVASLANEDEAEGSTNAASNSASQGAANNGIQGRNGSARMVCQLCPGDRIVARIDRDIDSRYTTNIELTVVQGRLEGARIFGSFRMVNTEAVLRSQSRLVLTTDNITPERNVAPFPAVVVDLESGSQIIDQNVKNYTAAKFVAVAATSIARRWSDLTVANSTTQGVTQDGQAVQQQQSLSETEVWQASGGWALSEFNDVARRWYNSAPVITIPKNELVSIMIVEPVELGWINNLEQGEDYL